MAGNQKHRNKGTSAAEIRQPTLADLYQACLGLRPEERQSLIDHMLNADRPVSPEHKVKTPAASPAVKLKLVDNKTPTKARPENPPAKAHSDFKLRLGTLCPPDDMKPDRYLADCTQFRIETKRKGKRPPCVIWQFVLQNGKYHGVGLQKYAEIHVTGTFIEVPRYGPLAKACETVLGRPLEDGDLQNLSTIFVGKRFVVFAGYQKTPERGGTASDELALRKKFSGDRMRVHEIIELVELP